MEYKQRCLASAIEYVLYSWRVEAEIATPLMYNINWDNHHVIIYTNYPSELIGMREKHINEFKKRMREVWPCFEEFEIYETWGCI